MPVARVASRYAKSIIELAEELNALEEVANDMLALKKTCDASRELRILLANPIINHEKKLAILNLLFSKSAHKVTQSFFQILARKNREELLYDISLEVERQMLVKKGIERAQLITSSEITSKQKESISEMLAKAVGKKIEIEERVNPEIIGGFVIKVDNTQIDNSIRTELKKIKTKFSDTTYINKL